MSVKPRGISDLVKNRTELVRIWGFRVSGLGLPKPSTAGRPSTASSFGRAREEPQKGGGVECREGQEFAFGAESTAVLVLIYGQFLRNGSAASSNVTMMDAACNHVVMMLVFKPLLAITNCQYYFCFLSSV